MDKEDVVGIISLVLTFVIIISIVLLATIPGYFVDKSVAIKALHDQGFTDINITKKDWLFVDFIGCGSDDAVKFTAMAKNPRNQTVEVYVCSGWIFKGATIRS